MSKKCPHLVVKNYRPMNLESASIQDLCLAEVVYEEMKNRRREGCDRGYTSAKQVEAKVRKKERELKATGKVTATIPPGMFGTADVNGQEAIILDKEFILIDPKGIQRNADSLQSAH